MRDEKDIVRRTAAKKPDWRYVVEWFDDEDRIIRSQEREKLDHVLPVALVRAALAKSKLKFYLSNTKILRSRRHSFFDKKLTALDAFDRFGGDAMEEALEYGSFSV
jgi:hypothetical protein